MSRLSAAHGDTGEIVPYARQNSYGFQIPALSETPSGGILAFAQAFVRKDGTSGHNQSTLQDGNDGLLNMMHSLRTFSCHLLQSHTDFAPTCAIKFKYFW